MCIAILAKPGASVPKQGLFRGWGINKDGGGFAFVDKDQKKVVIQKGFFKYNEFEEALEKAQAANPESPFLIHMRIKTSGAISDNNTHPFPIKDGALIHNGILFTPTGDDKGPVHDRKSDTRVFAEKLFNVLTFEDVAAGKAELERAVSGNKIAFLYDDARWVILNEAVGEWVDDVWYSNTGCNWRNDRNHWNPGGHQSPNRV